MFNSFFGVSRLSLPYIVVNLNADGVRLCFCIQIKSKFQNRLEAMRSCSLCLCEKTTHSCGQRMKTLERHFRRIKNLLSTRNQIYLTLCSTVSMQCLYNIARVNWEQGRRSEGQLNPGTATEKKRHNSQEGWMDNSDFVRELFHAGRFCLSFFPFPALLFSFLSLSVEQSLIV